MSITVFPHSDLPLQRDPIYDRAKEDLVTVAKRKSRSREESVGERLRRLRRSQGVTQVELAKKLGTIQAVVSDYERGKLRLHSQVIVDIAKALRISTDELLGLKPTASHSTVDDRRFLRRVEKIRALPRRDQQALLRTIDAFIRGHREKSA